MCGRYSITSAPEAIRALFRYEEEPDFPPRYNIAPTQPIPVVRLIGGKCRFALMRWGLVPAWVKDPAAVSLLINARGETVCEKPAFRNAMKYRRCLIPADGFYEWQAGARGKQPFYIRAKDGAPLAFAGLWETWAGPNGEEVDTATIVTNTRKRNAFSAARPDADDRAARGVRSLARLHQCRRDHGRDVDRACARRSPGVLAGLDVGQSCGKRPCRPDAAERTAA
jgi:hypothetical protein